ncbi:histamine N-methyltransferase A-like [Patiria miniata]|uniref:Histamine N-methyltransferase n=1 Tax=Patiria miniata TaxID=46514 RepID=A0A914B1K6_PATMI|nr:histamine N-methyltransferase A-like [Patiria miniata]XP_038069377.1 histamine N-methyltransferase A-like [Patiria miniata]
MKTLDETYYVQALEAFIERCDQEQVTLAWIRAKMPSLLKAVRWPVSTAEVVSVVGVGSGKGIMDVDVLKLVQQECPENPLHCIGIEPNPDELARYKKTAAGEKDFALGSTTFEWHEKISEEFESLLPSRPDSRYHVIHMFQMLYHVRDMEETIQNYYNKLTEGGLMVITIASKDGNDLLKAFDDYESTIPNLHDLPAQNMKRYSDDVLPILRRMAILHHSETVSYQVDVSECFVDGSLAGKMLLDFICLTNATCVYQSLAESDRSALLNSMSKYCKAGIGEDDRGRRMLTLTFDCITFYKGKHAQSVCNGVA